MCILGKYTRSDQEQCKTCRSEQEEEEEGKELQELSLVGHIHLYLHSKYPSIHNSNYHRTKIGYTLHHKSLLKMNSKYLAIHNLNRRHTKTEYTLHHNSIHRVQTQEDLVLQESFEGDQLTLQHTNQTAR